MSSIKKVSKYIFMSLVFFAACSAIADSTFVPVGKVVSSNNSFGLVPSLDDSGILGGINRAAEFVKQVIYIIGNLAGAGLLVNGGIQYYNHKVHGVYVRAAVPVSLIFCGLALIALVNIPIQGLDLRAGVDIKMVPPVYNSSLHPRYEDVHVTDVIA